MSPIKFDHLPGLSGLSLPAFPSCTPCKRLFKSRQTGEIKHEFIRIYLRHQPPLQFAVTGNQHTGKAVPVKAVVFQHANANAVQLVLGRDVHKRIAFLLVWSTWTQCRVANGELGHSDCCNSPLPLACNVPWYLDQALTRTNNFVSIPGKRVLNRSAMKSMPAVR